MKLVTRNTHEAETEQYQLHLPFGLIGLPELRRFEVAPISGSWPLLSMRSSVGEEMAFVVVQPHTLVAGYELEINDEDADLLRIQSAADALLFNIVTIHSLQPQYVTVNLVGPVVVNRHTSIGKQVIIVNFEHYSAQHALIDERLKNQST